MDYCEECSRNVSWIRQQQSKSFQRASTKTAKIWQVLSQWRNHRKFSVYLRKPRCETSRHEADESGVFRINFNLSNTTRWSHEDFHHERISFLSCFKFRFEVLTRRVDSNVDICFEIRHDCFVYLATPSFSPFLARSGRSWFKFMITRNVLSWVLAWEVS